MPSFIVSSSKYHRIYRYRFPKIFTAFERKIFNIEDGYSDLQRIHEHVQMSCALLLRRRTIAADQR